MTGVDANTLANLLNMSQRGVYRLLAAYERVHGRLPLRGKRKWVPEGAIEVLRRARDMVALGQARSFEAAFRALEGHVPSPDDRERIYRALEEIAARVSETPVILALLHHIKEELERTQREVGQIRLILYGAGFEQAATANDADVKELLTTPLLLRGKPRGYEEQVKRMEAGAEKEEPVAKRPVFGAKWERWAEKLRKLEEEGR